MQIRLAPTIKNILWATEQPRTVFFNLNQMSNDQVSTLRKELTQAAAGNGYRIFTTWQRKRQTLRVVISDG